MSRSAILWTLCAWPLLQANAHAQALQVHPAQIELVGPNARHRILVTAVAPDGVLRDVTGEAAFHSSNDGVLKMSGGECVPQGDGTGTIAVRFGGLSAQVAVTVRQAQRTPVPSFLNDVEPILTRLGCNQGACHGKNAGQNGFRLSLRGYAPEWDHGWITREFQGRRVNPTTPAQSLLLAKPTGQVPHEGGVLMKAGGREYRTLLGWIGAGAPGLQKDEPAVRRVEILPGNRLLRVGQTQRLLVRAEFADGQVKDVTWLTQFFSNDASVAEVERRRPGQGGAPRRNRGPRPVHGPGCRRADHRSVRREGRSGRVRGQE